MEKGADPLLKNKDGETPIDLDKNGYIKQFLEKKAIIKSIAAGFLTAVLGCAVTIILYATRTFTDESEMTAGLVAPLPLALIAAYATYGKFKPSTKVDEMKEVQNVNENV